MQKKEGSLSNVIAIPPFFNCLIGKRLFAFFHKSLVFRRESVIL